MGAVPSPTTLRCVFAFTIALLIFPSEILRAGEDSDFNYLVGRSKTDVTGPMLGVQMFGFVRADQITEGIHLRQYCRTFIMVDPVTEHRLAMSIVDMGSVTYEMWHEVLDRLHANFGDLYGRENFVLSATHTHSGPSGYWHYTANTPVGSPFYGEYFEAIVASITDSVIDAHQDLRPANIFVAHGMVENASIQRSKIAYMNNPAEERGRYSDNIDREMILLKFVDANGPIGTLNFFAVHPTTMTYYNRLISGDNKGYAAWGFEKQHAPSQPSDGEFVAAFAQSNCGDVTGNLNLDNTGPGEDDVETTQIIGQRQLDEALRLFDAAEERLAGPIVYRQQFVDFSNLVVDDEYTHAGTRSTAPAAYGYSFAAGSTEDGGGHRLFREGMTRSSRLFDNIARNLVHAEPLSNEIRAAHRPKAILFAPGEMDPPGYGQVLSLGLARLGQLAFVFGPAEFTTMTGRRIREKVAENLSLPPSDVVIAGFSNGYSGYVTTMEEYLKQQYEGGHTLFGPWAESGYRQQYARMATALAQGSPVDSGPTPRDVRGEAKSMPLVTAHDAPPEDANFGDVVRDANDTYHRGDGVQVVFWTGNPLHHYPNGDNAFTIESQQDGQWVLFDDDGGWTTKCRWKQPSEEAIVNNGVSFAQQESNVPGKIASSQTASQKAHQMWAEWKIPSNAPPGTYRLVHHGAFKPSDTDPVETFDAYSKPFQVE